MPRILDDSSGSRIELRHAGEAATASEPVVAHIFDVTQIRAINGALASNRPLLIYGEPGCGKSQLARAAAVALKRGFVSTVVDAQTQPRDLLYDIDLVERLARAQTMSVPGKAESLAASLALENFLRPGPLWWGLSAETAKERLHALPQQYEGCDLVNGFVVLIDEIDKADSSVPNGLLGALGDRGFERPDRKWVEQKGPAPLVVVTSNEERTLPAAFVRRCWVLRIEVPSDDAFEEYLVERGRAHFGALLDEQVLTSAAKQLRSDREEHQRGGYSAPGQAEYLDLCRAVWSLARDAKRDPGSLVAELAPYVFRKHLRT